MRTIRVDARYARHCMGCPFEDSGDGRPYCKADNEQRYTEPNHGEEWPTGRPGWCPLEAGPVVVELERG